MLSVVLSVSTELLLSGQKTLLCSLVCEWCTMAGLRDKTPNSHHRCPSQHLKQPKREHPNPAFNNPGNISPSRPGGAGRRRGGRGSQAAPRPRMLPQRLLRGSAAAAEGCPARSGRDRGRAPWAEGRMAAAALQVGSAAGGRRRPRRPSHRSSHRPGPAPPSRSCISGF